MIDRPLHWQERAEQARHLPNPFPGPLHSDTPPFDPTYGYTLDDLLAVAPAEAPADFAAFWQATHRETLAVDPGVTRRVLHLPEATLAAPHWRCSEVEFSSWQGFRVGGWLVEPAEPEDEEVRRIIVAGHGYGGVVPDPASPFPGTATLTVCARGFTRSARADLPGETVHHVVHGIQSREDYLIRGCVADLWAAATVLLSLYPQAALSYMGSSFGGGLGALALPWDERFRSAYLGCPTFGNHPLRVTLPCAGSGEAVRQLYRKQPGILETLQYYDASAAARFIRTPTLVNVGCYDPAVPPPGQFAVFNALGQGQGHELAVRTCHHFEAPCNAAEQAEIDERLEQWIAR